MQKHIFSILALVVMVMVLGACGAARKGVSTSSNTAGHSASVDGPSAAQWRNGIKGKWVLNAVTREDIPQSYTIKNIFDEAPVDCFIGSVWSLPGGNYKGSIAFNAEGTLCANGASRNIVWSVFEQKNTGELPQFQFKKVYSGEKAAQVNTGYRMNLSFSDGQSLVMRMPVNLDGSTGFLVFNFTKIDQ